VLKAAGEMILLRLSDHATELRRRQHPDAPFDDVDILF
jgi:hypothetical protein